MKKLFMISMISILLLQGCASPPVVKTREITGPAPLSVDERIAAASESAVNSLKELSLAEAAAAPKSKAQSNQAPVGLTTRFNVAWSGPVDTFLKKIADLSGGYTLVVRGKYPAIPVIVTVDAKAVSLFELIRNAGLQAGSRANVIIDGSNPDKKLIVLEFSV